MRIYIDMEGQEELKKKLADMVARGGDLKPPLHDAANVILGSVDKNFEAEGRPARWAPRSPKTLLALQAQFVGRAQRTKSYEKAGNRGKDGIIRRAVAKAVGHKILQVSGDLRKLITAEVMDTEARIGSSLPYARIHQLGGTIKGGIIMPKAGKKALAFYTHAGRYVFAKEVKRPAIKIPARPYLVVQPEDREKIIRIFTDWVTANG